MRRRRLGLADVPVIGIGTWNMERDDPARAAAAIRRAVELGMAHVDTAEMYGNGKVESLIGQALGKLRDRVFLVSKVLPRNASDAGVRKACEASLRRLGTDHLDLYLLHWRGDVPLAETVKAFEKLREQGKIRAWGVSNFDDGDLDELLREAGPGKIACNQVLYHLGERSIEKRVIPWCEQHGVAVVAYSPLGSGELPDAKLRALGLKATPAQVALAFLTRHAFAIPKTSRVEHVDELAKEVALDATTLAAIDQAFPCGPWKGLPTL